MRGRARPPVDRRAPGPRAAGPRAWIAGLLLASLGLLVPAGASAQTGLLLVERGPDGLAEAARGRVRWTRGPVEALELGAAAEGQVRRAVARLTDLGARRVVVVELAKEGQPAGSRPSPALGGERATDEVPVLLAGVVRIVGAAPAASDAHRIEARAREALDLDRRQAPPAEDPVFELDAVNVTATRTPLDVFGTAAPVSVVEPDADGTARASGELAPIEDVPGVELEGVGPARRQPVLRGFGGQRVLLLEDGLRLANSRRRLGSVEPAALAGPGTVERIEVVRGPASVLYGSDAIGGVVNLVTRGADPRAPSGMEGSARMAGSTAGGAALATVDAEARAGGVGLRVSASARSAGAYDAPPGRFGEVELPAGGTVHDSGARDHHTRAEVAVGLGATGRAFLRGETFRSEETGFGYVDPGLLGEDPTRVRLTFPDQRFDRLVGGWTSTGSSLPFADALEVKGFVQRNRRRFVTDVLAPLGPEAPRDARIHVETENRTDVLTVGGRVESTLIAGSHAVTWGMDLHRDRSRGSDTTTTTLRGLGPPAPTVRGGSQVPDATLTSTGVFVQDRLRAGRATDLTVGARYQEVRATADAGARHVDRTVVGSVSAVHFVRSDVALVASVARGFRSPNLVERFFSGPTPGGRGVWVRNPELAAETSLSLDVGARLRRPRLEAELFVHRTSLRSGIRVEPTGKETESGPEYRNENVERLVVRGVEAWGRWRPHAGLSVTASVEVLDRLNPRDPDDPLEGGARTRLQGRLAWAAVPDRLTLSWVARWRGGRRAPEDAGPVGPSEPAFHVHDLQAEILLADRHRLALEVENLTDRLWARPGNVDFFRPEPGRRLVVALTSTF